METWKSVSNAIGLSAFSTLYRDGWILFASRGIRMFAFGGVGVILALYLHALGLSDDRIGFLLFLTLIGDAIISLLVTLSADEMGRRRMLVLGCALKLLGAVVYAANGEGANFWVMAVAGAVAVISPSGNEVGPFMALEQSMLSDHVDPSERTMVFAWYNMLGYLATALGSIAVGFVSTHLTSNLYLSSLTTYRLVFLGYGVCAVILLVLVLFLTKRVELQRKPSAQVELAFSQGASSTGNDEEGGSEEKPLLLAGRNERNASSAQSTTGPAPEGKFMGLTSRSQGIVLRLSLLFSLDSFAGALVTGTLLAYYFQVRFGVSDAYLGGILFGANIIAGVSSLLSGWVAKKIGLVKTMVFTHLPSNILLMLVPVMPTLGGATAMVFLRSTLSQMDVVPRQSFVSGVVLAEERTATMGITNVVKSLSGACGPLLTGYLASQQLFGWAFYLCGGLKVLYDLLLLWSFHSMRAEHETH